MFDRIISWLSGFWSVLESIFQDAWNYARTGWLWIAGLVVAFVGCLTDVISWVGERVASVAADVVNMILPDANGAFAGVGPILDQANTFFPVSEGFAMAALLVAVLIIACGIRLVRWVKGIIPFQG